MRRAAWLAVAVTLSGCGTREDGRTYRMQASSMEPTLHCAPPGVGCLGREADEVLVRPFEGEEPKRGDIVAFETPARAVQLCGARGTYVKRIVALPGETWSQRRGLMYIDGRRLVEPYVRAANREPSTHRGGLIPPSRYLVLGDNRSQSCDSRVWGPLPRANVIGRVEEVKRGSERIRFR